MIVQHNILAMNANRNVKLNTSKVSTNTKKLASGYRINNSADDAAGLAISEKMRKQIRGLSQGSSNAQEGISMVQTAEGALNEVHDMIQRMNELAIHAANETLSDGDRAALQDEFEDLQEEIDRISNTTTFNDKLLFSSGIVEADYDEVSAIRGRFNAEIKGKISGVNEELDGGNTGNGTNNGATVINDEAEVIDNTKNQVGTYSLRNMARTTTSEELPIGTGNINLSELKSDFVITDTGYILNGVEYSYTGAYNFEGETTQKVTINSATDDSGKVNISLADGAKLGKLDVGNYADVTLKTEGNSNISSISVDSSSKCYINGNGTNSSVKLDTIKNSGIMRLQTKAELSGTFSNSGSMYIQNRGKLKINNGDINNEITNNGDLTINSECELEVIGNFTNKDYIYNSGNLNIHGNVNNSSTFSSYSGKLNVAGNINTTSGSSTIGGIVTVGGDINTTGGSTSVRGTSTIAGDVKNEVGSTSIGGTTTIEGNINNTSGTVSTSGIVTVNGNVNNTSKMTVSGTYKINGEFTNGQEFIVNNAGNVITNNKLINNGNILIDGGGTLKPNSSLENTNIIRINTFGKLDGTNTHVITGGNIKVEDHYEMNDEMKGYISEHLDTITLNMSVLSDVSLTDSGFEVSGRIGSPYTNMSQNRVYRIKGQTYHSTSIDDINIKSGNVKVYVEEEKIYVGKLNVVQGAQVEIEGSGKLIADDIIGDAPLTDTQLFKYYNGTIDLGNINDTLEINSYGYKVKNEDTKYYTDNSITFKGSISNDGDSSNKNLDIVINSNNKSIKISNDCIVNEITLNVSNVDIYGNKLVASKINKPNLIKWDAELYEIGSGNIDLSSISGRLTVGDNYYQFNNTVPKRYNAGEYSFSGTNKNLNITINSPNVINIADDCMIGTLTYNSTQPSEVKGDGKLICNDINNVNKTDVLDEKMVKMSPFTVNLSDVKDSLFITKDGYKKDNINYLVDKENGITLKGSTDKNIYIDSDRIVSLNEVEIVGDLVVLQPTEASIQVVNESSIANLIVQKGSELNVYGVEPLYLTGESYNMGNMESEKIDIYQEGIFTNIGEFINKANLVNIGLISNAEEGVFINKESIANEGVINNFAKLENDRDGVITNNKFIYNIGEINNMTDAIFDNNSVIENKYKMRNKGTLDNYEGSIENYYSVAGTVLGNQPLYVYDGSRTENALDIQAGAEKDDKIYIDIFQMNSRVLGIQKDRVNIRTVEDTTNAIVGVSFALEKLSKQRSMLGSYQNRLEHAIKNLDNAVENTTSAESSIRDTDMAKEMVEYSNNNIISQSAQSMLAQANQINNGVLRLLN